MKNLTIDNPFIRKRGERLFTTSVDVAEKFGKRHDHVLAAARKIVNANPEFGRPNFRETSYTDEWSRSQPMFEMSRSGFSILAMGFTGPKALEWKIKYEAAFTAMEAALLRQRNLSWQDQRSQSKAARREVTDTVQAFILYAESQGSTHAKHYYKHITTAAYKALFIVRDQGGSSFRDLLDSMQLSFLTTAEFVAAKAIEDGMRDGLFYRDIYKLAKDRIESFAGAIPRTNVIALNRRLEVAA